MKPKAIDVYVFGMSTAALVSLVTLDWAGALPPGHYLGFFSLIFLGLLSESSALTHVIGKSAGTSSLVFLPVLACVLLFGPAATVVFFALTGVVAEYVIRKKEPVRVLFNVSQYIVSATIAGWFFYRLGGAPLSESLTEQVIPFVAFALVFLGFNHGAVTVAIALSQSKPFGEVWKGVFGQLGGNYFVDLAVCPVAILVAFLYQELAVWGFVVSILPLMFIRYSYLSNFNLQASNRDLLQVLVKAIETRDPYTSGHSLRVSKLAGRIAQSLNLPGRTVSSITTAALLHDIGKIDIVYEEILNKPGSLSDDEREVIESHVLKGVELLTSLSSFSSDVIGAVRHHHEWFDGNGYPDKIAGDAIPLGARIIKVCDAIDAMLSDRSYRKALTIHEVRLQLTGHSGTQFDAAIVRVILDSNLLEAHAKELADEQDAAKARKQAATEKEPTQDPYSESESRPQSESMS